jgi:hydrogenase maturation factor
MCLTYPAEVISVEGDEAVVRTEDGLRRANTLAVPDVAIGDRVIVAAGSIVTRLDPTEADEIRRLLHVADGHEEAPIP